MSVTLWSADSDRLLASLHLLPPDGDEQVATEWLVLTPDGYYVGSGGAERFLRWRAGDRVSPAEAYERSFYRPDRVQQALRGESLPPPQP